VIVSYSILSYSADFVVTFPCWESCQMIVSYSILSYSADLVVTFPCWQSRQMIVSYSINLQAH